MTPISFSEPPPTQKNPEKIAEEVNGTNSGNELPKAVKNSSQLPVVVLDVDCIADTLAARLAINLLGHVLFLKNQIPLPIIQLARMPNGKSSAKVSKLRADLLSSYDTLASHLVTTFSALSTALAQSTSTSTSDQTTSRVYLAILIGPSLGAVKSRVIYGVDSFAIRVWGKRDDHTSGDEDNWSGEEFPEGSEDGDDGGNPNSDMADSHDVIAGSGPDSVEHDGDHEPEESGESEDDESYEEVGSEEEEDLPSPSQCQSYAEEQRFLQTADRLLSRTLASADAEGQAISNEMSPSRTYILIRAPRRFTHPAWVPRQNVTKQMEAALADFLEESWPSSNNVRVGAKKKRVEGLWVAPNSGLGCATPPHQEEAMHESDEMIWWSWDGKFIGFSDW